MKCVFIFCSKLKLVSSLSVKDLGSLYPQCIQCLPVTPLPSPNTKINLG